ncbi:MAG: type II toxin-antitoxin system VapC family toxin [Gallionellaceae bacterium]|nr:type II toxin-antitoxin system VapC family toxin [Gallionellaceae bacterium]
MIRHLIDTDIASYFLKKNSSAVAARLHDAMAAGEAAISVITRAELRYGLALLTGEVSRRQALVDAFLREIPTLAWTSEAADIYALLAATQKKTNQPIGYMDTQIAAHALAENLILVSNNTRHYQRIPGLKLENWAE